MKFFFLVIAVLSADARAETVTGRVLAGGEPAWRVAVVLDGDGPPAEPSAARLDAVWYSFVPKVQVLAPGSTLTLENHDDASHTAHARLNGLTQFHVATVPRREGAPLMVTLPTVGAVKVGCEMHAEMHALVVVSRSRWHAVTDEDGRFAIPDVPPGRYRVRAVWWGAPAHPAGEEAGDVYATAQVPGPPVDLALPASARETERRVSRPLSAGDRSRPTADYRPRASWPSGIAVYFVSFLGLVLGLGGALAAVRLGARRKWPKLASVVIGCGLAFLAGVLYLAGLHGAVATALGFGLFLGTVVFGAAD